MSGVSGAKPSRPRSSGPRHVYKTGAAGCGGKPAPTTAKNAGQPLPCPFCDRIFKQDGRLKEHLKNQHDEESLEQPQSEEALSGATKIAEASASRNQSSSYTVKTPKTLLHEWCQKQGKPTVKYKHVEVDGGFHCRVILPDPKKSEADVILWYRDAVESTSQEAQHRAAVVALHHVLGNRRLDRILPEQYTQQWRNLDAVAEERNARLKANPPRPKRKPTSPQELHSVFMSEGNRRLVEDLLRSADTNSKVPEKPVDSFNHSEPREGTGMSFIEHDVSAGSSTEGMESMKALIEDEQHLMAVARLGNETFMWEAEQSNTQSSSNLALSERTNKLTVSLHRQLAKMGFSQKYVTMAAGGNNDISSALDWLVLNVPECDLPAKFAPVASKASVQVLVREKNLSTQLKAAVDLELAFLQQYGYSADDCQSALLKVNGNKELALHDLFKSLLAAWNLKTANSTLAGTDVDLDEMRSEEKLALLSIFGDDAIQLSDSSLRFRIGGIPDLEMEVRYPPGCLYPYEIPLIGFNKYNLTSQHLLWMTKKTANHALQLVGSPMIYDLVTFAQEMAATFHSAIGTMVDHDDCKHDFFPVGSPETLEKAMSGVPDQSREKSVSIDLSSGLRSAAYQPPASQTLSGVARNSFNQNVYSASPAHSTRGRRRNDFSPCLESASLKSSASLHKSAEAADMQATRSKLPAFRQRGIILTAIEKSQVTIICGETGCGKSTQVPQYVLESYIEQSQGSLCNIVCTQPRRLSAIGLADRVAKERCEGTGVTVGYSVRLESCRSEHTRLLFCTTGILLRRLLSDPHLEGISHVIVDEVHERTLESDLLLLLIRELIRRSNPSPQPGKALSRDKSSLRVILMSATVDSSLYANYFRDVLGYVPTVVQIPGFTFPVRELYLEDALEITGYRIGRTSRYSAKKKQISVKPAPVDHRSMSMANDDVDSWESRLDDHEHEDPAQLDRYSKATQQSLAVVDETIINFELIEALILSIFLQEKEPSTTYGHLSTTAGNAGGHASDVHRGAVLVFLPGVFEIKKLQSRLLSSTQLAECGFKLWILALHGSLSGDEQRQVFLKPPAGVRKVVLATNIAETSITIDDVVYVLDSGHHKEMRYDHTRGLSCLEDCWISKANAKQRRGRAGRVQPGCCFYLFTREQFQRLDEHQLPEVLRISLEGLCLKVKSLVHGKVEERVAEMISPPLPGALVTAMKSLQELNAFDSMGYLTPLGQHLARMPVDARVGKMLLFGCILQCLDPVLTIAASLSGRSPFLSPMEKREEAGKAHQTLAGSSKSDHMGVVMAYKGWLNARQSGWSSEMEYCNSHYLSREALVGIEASRADYQKVLVDLEFITASSRSSVKNALMDKDEDMTDSNSNSIRVVKAVICAGFYPNIVRVQHPAKLYVHTEGGAMEKAAAAREVRFFSKEDGRVYLHPSSALFSVGHFDSPWVVYSEKVKTSKVFVKECSMVPAYGLLLFGGEIKVKHEKQTVTVDHWLEFEAPARIAVLIKELRSKVDSLLLQKIQNPSLNVRASPVVAALISLLTTDGF